MLLARPAIARVDSMSLSVTNPLSWSMFGDAHPTSVPPALGIGGGQTVFGAVPARSKVAGVVRAAAWALVMHRRKVVKYALCAWFTYIFANWIRTKRRQAADATSEWGRYAAHPGARGRAAATLLFAQLLPLHFLSRILFPFKKETERRDRYLRWTGGLLCTGLLQLGPLYIKLGQIVSCREKFLPEQWKKSLERLQDQVPAKSGQDALDLAAAAWPAGGDDFHRTFSDFETKPLAAASLGQVHMARLANTNETVAIKLQRAYLREIYDKDFVLLTKIAELVDRFGGAAAQVGGVEQSWTEIFEDAEEILYREIDYRDEAENAIRFCNDFGLDKGGKSMTPTAVARDGKPLPSAAPWLRTPYVYSDLSTEKVLTMEFVPSIKVTNGKALDEANVTAEEREYLADCLARSYLRQFCNNLFFSTDPHPGNLGVEILREQDGKTPPEKRVRLVYYDFGQAAYLNQNQADGILDIIEAIVDMDVDRSMEGFQKMQVLKDGADLDAVRAKVADNFKTGKVKANRKKLKKKGYKFKKTTTTTNFNSTATTNTTNTTSHADDQVVQYFTLPAEYAFVGRALSQMDGVGKFLDPEFDFVSSAAPWIYEIKGATKYLKEEICKWLRNRLPKSLKKTKLAGEDL
jgi:predicted unusual protein kinase regulating ubiquinone biosynthesis (AarF/ABC1/UbiB family)